MVKEFKLDCYNCQSGFYPHQRTWAKKISNIYLLNTVQNAKIKKNKTEDNLNCWTRPRLHSHKIGKSFEDYRKDYGHGS